MLDGARFLAGKVALVTGSSTGAGAAIAKELARHGARVAVHYRRTRSEAEAVRDAIQADGGEAETFAADVARGEEVRRLADEVARTGRSLNDIAVGHLAASVAVPIG